MHAGPLHQQLVLVAVAAADDQQVLGGDEPLELLEPVRLPQDLDHGAGGHLARGGAGGCKGLGRGRAGGAGRGPGRHATGVWQEIWVSLGMGPGLCATR